MSTISLRLPDSLHNTARELAKKDHVSISQFVAMALAEKILALTRKMQLQIDLRYKPLQPNNLLQKQTLQKNACIFL